MKTNSLKISLALLILLTGCEQAASKPETQELPKPAQQAEAMKSQGEQYIVTGKTLPAGAPFYKNGVRGAAHIMQASDGTYYSYASTENQNWPINRSKDLIHWKKLPNSAFPKGTWAISNFWVPKVIENNGKFLMYYAARDAEGKKTVTSTIGVAVSDKPGGPFIDTGKKLLDGTSLAGFHVIDPKPFIDPETGKKYLYVSKGAHYYYYHKDFGKEVKHSIIYGMELSDDMMHVVGEPVELIRPSQKWEYESAKGSGTLWNEAPQVFLHNGTYYLTYSANNYTTNNYAVGVAMAKSPLGPFTKYELNPIISELGAIKKAGHSTEAPSPDGSEYFTAYTTKDGRFMSRMGFRYNGTVFVNGPIKGYQWMPGGSSDYINFAASKAKITTSSTKAPYRNEALTDGEVGMYARFEKYEWESDGEKGGAWVQVSWDQPQKVEYIVVNNSAVRQRMVDTGTIILNGDSQQAISGIKIPTIPGEAAILHFPEPKEVNSVKFVVDKLVDPQGVAGLSEMMAIGKK